MNRLRGRAVWVAGAICLAAYVFVFATGRAGPPIRSDGFSYFVYHFTPRDSRPMLVSVTVDAAPAGMVRLQDGAWQMVTVTLPPRGSRRVRRIDLRTSVTREDNRGVRVGEIEVVRVPVAARLLSRSWQSDGAKHSS